MADKAQRGVWIYDLTDIIGARKEAKRVVPITKKLEIQQRTFRFGLFLLPVVLVVYFPFQMLLDQWAALPAVGVWLALTAVLTSNATRGLRVSRAQRARNSFKFKDGRLLHLGEPCDPTASPMVQLWYMDALLTGEDAARAGGADGLDELLGTERWGIGTGAVAPTVTPSVEPAVRGPVDLSGVERDDIYS